MMNIFSYLNDVATQRMGASAFLFSAEAERFKFNHPLEVGQRAYISDFIILESFPWQP
jgi:hypothetical protein